MYLIVKHTHVILATLSIALFQFRYWFFQVPRKTPHKVLKVGPHIIDTLLLSAGIYLAFVAGFSPFQSTWLSFKLLALIVYIVFGYKAMKGKNLTQWSSYFIATLAVVYMVLVAVNKSPWAGLA